MEHLWIILTAVMVVISTAVTGSFLLLRKSSMVADAISHAVLPGLVIAYLFTSSRSSLIMLVGAALSGLLVTLLIELIQKKAKLQQDASIGISYTFLFAVGIILVSQFGSQIDLDQECVLYGEIAFVPLDRWMFNGVDLGPRQFWITSGLALFTLLGLVLGYKGLLISSFDANYAKASGFNVVSWNLALMSFTSLDAVVAFESVGAILVIAFLVGPAATAFLISRRLPHMLVRSVLFGISASILGYLFSWKLNVSIAGSIALVIGVQFGLVFSIVHWRSNKSHQLSTLLQKN
jgi:manganese/zinc/iron transport system permease protein